MSLNRPSSLFCWMLVATTTLLARPLYAAPPMEAIFDMAPADAELVIVVPSLSGLSEKIAATGDTTGLNAYAPDMNDALASFKRQMGFLEGVDDDGSMVVTITGLAKALEEELAGRSAPEPTAILLVPVSDYKTFTAQLGGDPAADVTAIKFDSNSGFAREMNGYAVLGETVEIVNGYTAGKQGKALIDKLSDLPTHYLKSSDAMVYLDMAPLADGLNLAVDKSLDEFKKEFNREASQLPASITGGVEGAMEAYADFAHTLINGGDSVLFGLDVTEAGIGMTCAMQMKKDSDLAGFFTPDSNDKLTAASLLASLPDQPYIYAASLDAESIALDGLVDKIIKAMEGDGEAQDNIMAMYAGSFESLKDTRGVASVFYAPQPSAMMTGGFFTSLTVYDVADADAFIKLQKENYAKLAGTKIEIPAMQEGQPASNITFESTFTDKALVIDGVDVHQYQVKVVLPAEMMQQFGSAAMFMGNSGTTGYIAGKGNKVLVSTVTDPQLITSGLKALDAADGVGAAGILAELRQTALPPDPAAEAYFSVAGLVQTINPFLPMISPNSKPLELPADLAPVAYAASAKDTGLAMRCFIPSSLISFGIDTYRDLVPEADGTPRDGAPRAPRAF